MQTFYKVAVKRGRYPIAHEYARGDDVVAVLSRALSAPLSRLTVEPISEADYVKATRGD